MAAVRRQHAIYGYCFARLGAPTQNFVKLDTTHEPLEGLVSELGIKALPAFRFFKARRSSACDLR